MRKPTPLIPDRFWAKVRPDSDGCWIWTAATGHGYGKYWNNGGTHIAHRWLYQLLNGSLGSLTLDHLCKQTLCVNPAHLEPVDMATNALRGDGPPARNARATHCSRGHEFTPANTIVRLTENGKRRCRTCRSETHGHRRQAA